MPRHRNPLHKPLRKPLCEPLRKHVQLEFPAPRTHGGKRKGAGRKPKHGNAGVPHRPREGFASRFPLHVTLRMERHVFQLRSRRCFKRIETAFFAGCNRFGCRLVHYSIQRNHLHLLCEAEDKACLAKAVKGLAIRIARALNRLMDRKGAVFADRYHSRILRTPTDTRMAIVYVLQNERKHGIELGHWYSRDFLDPYSSARFFDGWEDEVPPPAPEERRSTAKAEKWLLREGWRRAGGLISLTEVPAHA